MKIFILEPIPSKYTNKPYYYHQFTLRVDDILSLNIPSETLEANLIMSKPHSETSIICSEPRPS
jgi:hypothetical protein